jgi:hypothetical protein
MIGNDVIFAMSSDGRPPQRQLPGPIEGFLRAQLLPYHLVALIQVGSTARGYGLAGADFDFMAFYEGGDLRSHPCHDIVDGVQVTLEHHDLDTFIEQIGDYRFNLASLRQLHKVRDGIHHRPVTASFDVLARIADGAHLDRSVLLQACGEVALAWPSLPARPTAFQQQQIISWTELLAMLNATSRAGQEAYSKPKWLYRTLRGTGQEDAILLLDHLYQPSKERAERALEALRTLADTDQLSSLRDTDRRLMATALTDAADIAAEHPDDSLPQMRFAACQYHRLLHGVHPLGLLRRGEALARIEFLTAMSVDAAADPTRLRARFIGFFGGLATELEAEFREIWSTRIGSRRLFTHILATYEGVSILPHAVEPRVLEWVAALELVR